MICQYSRFSLLDLLQVLLHVQLPHLFLELILVSLGSLLRLCPFPPLLGLFLIQTVEVFFLGLLDTFLSLFFFGFVIGTFFEFF